MRKILSEDALRNALTFGNNSLMTALEERGQPFLFKLKLSKNVKRHIGRLFRQPGWTDAGQGWEGEGHAKCDSAWHSR